MARGNNSKFVYYKFVVYQVKQMVYDSQGKPSHMKAFDHVFYDLYGVREFSLKMSRMYHNADIEKLINKIGLPQLMKLFKNPTYTNVLYELVMIADDIRILNKKIVKKYRKGDTKNMRYEKRECTDLLKLYNKCIKALRKSMKIKNVHNAYKDKYQNVRSFIGMGTPEAYWDDICLGEFDSLLNDVDDDDDLFGDFDPDNSSIFDDFERALHGVDERPRKRRRRQSFEYEEDDDDAYDEMDYETGRGRDYQDPIAEKVNNLCNQMQSLSDTVQGLASAQRYNQVNRQQVPPPQPQQMYSNYPPNVPPTQSSDMSEIKNCLMGVVNSVNAMNQNMMNMDQRLSEFEAVVGDDEDEDAYVGSGYNPYAHNLAQNMQNSQRQPVNLNETAAIINAMNNAQEFTEDQIDKIVKENM